MAMGKVMVFLTLMAVVTGNPIFAATYIVDIQHPKASDTNPGTPELPFKTISKAAEVVQAGDTVIVKAGVYRETVRMQRGGTPQKPIVFVSEPIGSVIIKGSEIIGGWERTNANIWRKTDWQWAGKLGTQTGRDFVFRREQVFCDGKPLRHVEQKEHRIMREWMQMSDG
ncbi:hypothetical protein HRbin17_01662 [bacterium HR17]|jgi:hypothetical protein|uniref:Pel9A-like right handed beta-helix region domain-containing protein n=1 Tax=Candidatus Fervidibacter japonicus TaxID=2035412 RepID=A0A2H5XD81_9BACT|nr:hypothetical protein HRbin17_01662 [bacterium HR17]